MKSKFFLFSFPLLGLLAFSSCKKSWTCECQTGWDKAKDKPTYQSFEIKEATKRDAKMRCDGSYYDGPFHFEGGTTCKIK